MRLVEELCTWFQIHPCQLDPATMRLLLCVDHMREKYNLTFSVEYFFLCYFVKHENLEIGRYIQNAWANAQVLVLGFSSNESRWEDKYFFVKGPTRLGKGLGYPPYWGRFLYFLSSL